MGFIKDQQTHRKLFIGNCDLTATKLLKKRFLLRQQHLKLAQTTFERSQASSIIIEEPVQDFSESDEDSSNPELVLTSHKRKAFTAVRKSPQNFKGSQLLNLALSMRKNWGR